MLQKKKKKKEENNYRTSVEIFVAERILGNVYRNVNQTIQQTNVSYRIVSYRMVNKYELRYKRTAMRPDALEINISI